MKNKLFILFTAGAFALTFGLAGCDSLLDIDPQQSIDESTALQTSGNVEAALIGAYDSMGFSSQFGGRGSMMEPDLLADNGEVQWSGTFSQPREYFLKDIQTDNSFVEANWNSAYNTINRTNNVLGALDVVNPDIQARVEGEAKFIRGMTYFMLVRHFGKAWNDGDPASNLAVPIVLSPTRDIDEAAQVPRNTVQEVYNQILADLNDAKDLLPASNGFFANTYTASGILSRVHLQRGDYAEAAAEADRVIESGHYELVETFDGVFNQASNTSEDIFAMQVTAQDGTHGLNTYYAASGFGGRGDIEIQQQHLDLYEAGDARLDLFYDDGGETRTGKFNNSVDGNVIVLRLAEMYLTRAEANYREGTDVGDTPLNDLNRIRERANLAPLGEIDSVDQIWMERKLELAFEGHLLHDIKRTERNVGPLAFNSPRLVHPIPQREMDANRELVQNDGY